MRNLLHSFSLRPYSDILFVSEGMNWSTSWDILELSNVAEKLGIKSRFSPPLLIGLPRQSIFFVNRHPFLKHPLRYKLWKNRIAFPYYHGDPSSGDKELVQEYNNLRKCHEKVSRIQVTNFHMKNVVLESGIAEEKVFLIPISINKGFFGVQTPESKITARRKYQIPQNAVVVGSFQKDGVGWGEGLEPKFIKGPDIFLNTVEILKDSIPEFFVLLSGPARGYVKKGLEKLNIPYKHIYIENYPEIGGLYHCLDLYMVTSREEGGPKSVLEAMAAGVPLITTRVGQATDMVRNGYNGMIVDVEDTENIVFACKKILNDSELRKKIIQNGSETAKANTYMAHIPLWREFFKDFVES
jgi:glycosyltransferase involved in cell wall biosynthesis